MEWLAGMFVVVVDVEEREVLCNGKFVLAKVGLAVECHANHPHPHSPFVFLLFM